MDTKNCGFNTKLIHAEAFEDRYGSVSVPIYQTSTFSFKNVEHGAALFAGKDHGYIYTRISNPTINAFEDNIAALENGTGGIATSSGMGAVTTVYMSLLDQGAHMVSTASVYGPSRGVMESHFSRFGVESTYVDTSVLENVEKAIQPNTRLINIETPSNPTIQVTDIKAVSELAHAHGCLVVVDNTFATPHLQKPLDLGADAVLHSITKFINGHADIVGGVIVTKTEELYQRIRPLMVAMGCCMDPHQAYMALRGVRTLALRVERSQENAMEVARWMENHPKVEWVRYVGLESHPQYALAKKQMNGSGSMISFGLKGGLDAGRILMDNVHLLILAVSLGGVESLIQHPASMTHAGVSRENRLKAGITDGLVRLSVGIEDVDDLIADLEQAFEKIPGY